MDLLKRFEFVTNQLLSYRGVTKPLSNGLFILCPFHNEDTPSGRIFLSPNSRSPGYFKCYGCGQVAKWDTVAPLLGLKPFQWTKPTVQFAHSIVKPLEDLDVIDNFRFLDLPTNKFWRGISTNLLIDIGCRVIEQWGESYVYMPIMIHGEERGYTRARMRKDPDKPSYLNKKGKWSENYGLFPYDYAVKNDPETIVLVEGQRDALRLLSHGIPAMAILGTQSWSKKKSQLLEMSGAVNIILLMDGDCAGAAAEELIAPSLKHMFNVEIFSLRGKDSPYWPYRNEDAPTKAAKAAGVDLWDGFNMPKTKLKELKRLIGELNEKGKSFLKKGV